MSRASEITLIQSIAHYERGKYRSLAREEANAYRKLRPHLDVAIQSAVKFSPRDGRKHRHQRKLPDDVLSKALSELLNAKAEIGAAKDFEHLHAIVHRRISKIGGIGPLAVYDIAHRAQKMKISFVYIKGN